MKSYNESPNKSSYALGPRDPRAPSAQCCVSGHAIRHRGILLPILAGFNLLASMLKPIASKAVMCLICMVVGSHSKNISQPTIPPPTCSCLNCCLFRLFVGYYPPLLVIQPVIFDYHPLLFTTIIVDDEFQSTYGCWGLHSASDLSKPWWIWTIPVV